MGSRVQIRTTGTIGNQRVNLRTSQTEVGSTQRQTTTGRIGNESTRIQSSTRQTGGRAQTTSQVRVNQSTSTVRRTESQVGRTTVTNVRQQTPSTRTTTVREQARPTITGRNIQQQVITTSAPSPTPTATQRRRQQQQGITPAQAASTVLTIGAHRPEIRQEAPQRTSPQVRTPTRQQENAGNSETPRVTIRSTSPPAPTRQARPRR